MDRVGSVIHDFEVDAFIVNYHTLSFGQYERAMQLT